MPAQRMDRSKPEFPSAYCRKRSLCPKTRRDKMHAGSQMHRYPGRSPRCVPKWNRANAWATYALWPRQSVVAAERLKFHPASAYNYSGEHAASKVPFSIRDTIGGLAVSNMKGRLSIVFVRRGYSPTGGAETSLKTPRGRSDRSWA